MGANSSTHADTTAMLEKEKPDSKPSSEPEQPLRDLCAELRAIRLAPLKNNPLLKELAEDVSEHFRRPTSPQCDVT